MNHPESSIFVYGLEDLGFLNGQPFEFLQRIEDLNRAKHLIAEMVHGSLVFKLGHSKPGSDQKSGTPLAHNPLLALFKDVLLRTRKRFIFNGADKRT